MKHSINKIFTLSFLIFSITACKTVTTVKSTQAQKKGGDSSGSSGNDGNQGDQGNSGNQGGSSGDDNHGGGGTTPPVTYPVVATWRADTAANAPAARSFFSASTISNKIYYFGGNIDAFGKNDLYSYDPSGSGAWANLSTPTSGTPPTARFGHTSVAIDNKLYIFAGAADPGEQNSLYSYDPSAKKWTDLSVPTSGTAPSKRESHSAVAIEGKMYVFGGISNGNILNDLYSYDPSNKKWTNLSVPASGSAPQARYGHTAVMIDDKMYVFGGFDTSYNYLGDLFVYDPQAGGRWTNLSTPATAVKPDPRVYHASEVIDKKLYIFGGMTDASNAANDLFSYDPSTQTWKNLSTPLVGTATGLASSYAAVVNRHMYIFGGSDENLGLLNKLMDYTP